MVKQIDLFMPPFGQFGILEYNTHCLHKALIKAGIESTILTAEKNNPKPFLEHLMNHRPDCTLSFNGLLPDAQGHFLCDMLRIPHVACLVDTAHPYAALSKSPLTLITCPDQQACEFFHNLHRENVLFLPHAVDQDLSLKEQEDKKDYDVVFLGACFDYEAEKKRWKDVHSLEIVDSLELASEIVLSNRSLTFYEAIVSAINERVWIAGADLQTLSFLQLIDDLETYIRGKDRIGLIQSIKDVQVDVFTYKDQIPQWKKLLGSGHENVIFHPHVPFSEALEIMRKSKLVLNSTPTFKAGAHERIFSSLACGSMVMTSQSSYVEKVFSTGNGVITYDLTNVEKINTDIHKYLFDNQLRNEEVARGKEIVLKEHTWDNRVKAILEWLERSLPDLPIDAK